MANMFEKPLAVNPISQFNPLPLQFMNQLQQQEEAKTMRIQETASMLQDTLFSTGALPGDVARHQELIQEQDNEITQLANSEEDFGTIMGKFAAIKSKIMGSARNGELAAINSAYRSGMASREDLLKRYQDGKIKKEGLDNALRVMSSHRTEKDEYGRWATFTPYTPSNEVDPYGTLRKTIQSVNNNAFKSGGAFMETDQIAETIRGTMDLNPEIERSIREDFLATYNGPNDMKTKMESYEFYKNHKINTLINQEQYDALSKASSAGESFFMQNFAAPSKGKSTVKGTSASLVKEIGSWMGFETKKEFDNWKNSEAGRLEISNREDSTQSKMPTNFRDAVKWLEETDNQENVFTVRVNPVPDKEKYGLINKDGFMVGENAIRRKESNEFLDADYIKENILGTDDKTKQKAFVVGKITEENSELEGNYVIKGKDGKDYVMENYNVKDKLDDSYMQRQLELVTKKEIKTGIMDVTLPSSMNAYKMVIPQGTYEVRTDRKNGAKGIILYQNNIPKFTHKIGHYINGEPVYGIYGE